MSKKHDPRPSDRLWKTVRLWSWLFIGSTVAIAAAFAYRLALLRQIPGDAPMDEFGLISDYLPGAEAEVWTSLAASLAYLVCYLVCIFLVLKWYLRSVRNARALSNGIETSPGWVVWSFIVPLISLWKPYAMTSELWRSSHEPESWRGKTDPALLRYWWGAVLLSGLVISVSSVMSRAATTVAHVAIGDGVLIVGYLLQIAAGLLFLKIGGPISRNQTRLIAEGRLRSTPQAGEYA